MSACIYHPLSSGSKGNVTFIASKDTRLLIDVGLSFKQLVERLDAAQIDPGTIDAIILTHEHSDHIKGLEAFSKRYPVPVLCTHAMALHLRNEKGLKLPYKIFPRDEAFTYGTITIEPFSVSHDAVDPVMFVFQIQGLRIGHCTDLGFVSSLVAKKLKGVDVLLIESNHDVGMVHSSKRPDVYKRRVLSRVGHLSNEASCELVDYLSQDPLKVVYLGHLSEECNHPEKALLIHRERLLEKMDKLEYKIAYQDVISEPFFWEEKELQPHELLIKDINV